MRYLQNSAIHWQVSDLKPSVGKLLNMGPRQEFGGVGVRAVCCKQQFGIQPGRYGGLLGLGTGTKPGISD